MWSAVLWILTNAWSCVSTTTVLDRTDPSIPKFLTCCLFVVNSYFQPLTLGNHWSISGYSRNEIMQSIAFWVWLFDLVKYIQDSSILLNELIVCSYTLLSGTLLYGCISLYYPLMVEDSIWVVCSFCQFIFYIVLTIVYC